MLTKVCDVYKEVNTKISPIVKDLCENKHCSSCVLVG